MTLDGLLTAALNVAFLGVFILAFVDYLRRPDPIRRAVAAVFGSLALVFAVQILRAAFPDIPPIVGVITILSLLAQPLLTLYLISHFRPVSRRLGAVAVFWYLVVCAALLLGWASQPIVLVGVVGYFVGLELFAASLLAREARSRAGSSRTRLAVAAAATALFGASIFVVAAGSLAGSGQQAAAVATAIGRLLALLAALGYLVAFEPPRWLRQFGQQATAYEFIRDLGRIPPGTPAADIWGLLARTAQSVTGATGAAVSVGPGDDPVLAATAGDWPSDGLVADAALEGTLTLPIAGEGDTKGSLTLLVRGRPLFVDDDVELLGLLGARAAVAVERELLIEELRHASAAKSEFLAAMSHELRTPLNAIIGFSELLLRAPDEGHDKETVGQFADHIHGSGLHLLDLINDVLDLAKVEAGRLDLRLARIDVAAIVTQTLATMGPLAERRSISLGGPGAGSFEIDGDPGRIRQIVFNLVSNAIKFTPEGGRVDVKLEAPDGELLMTVSDTGPGIAPTDHARIFEAFRQLHRGDANHQQGTGLGLALTRQLVEAHGGRIELDSDVGRGSRFTVVLPMPRPVTEPVPIEPAALEAGSSLVLVIEDDPRAAELLRLYLADAGFSVAIATDGRAGLEQAERLRPSAIILDIMLPDVDGWEVLQRLKGTDGVKDIPVVVASVVDDKDLGIALGAVDYFVKPVARDSLLTALGRLTFTTKVKERTVSVLVIDGDPDAAERYRTVLPPGFAVSTAPTGAAGLDRATASKPDLILLDLLLPDLDGFEVVNRLRADERTSDIPIWVATREGLSAEDKTRLNGNVQGITEHGNGGIAGLHEWLGKVATTEVAR